MGTQLRLRSTKILIINLGAIGTEVIKNLVLGGLNSIEILDNSTVKEEDFASQFFLPNDDKIIGEKKLPLVIGRIRELNNRVNLSINMKTLNEALQDEEYFKSFDLIIATEVEKDLLLQLNQLTRKLSIPLYVSGMHGMFAYIITDLIEHISTTEMEAGNQSRKSGTQLSRNKIITSVSIDEKSKKELVTITDHFTPISEIFHSKELPNQLNKRQLKRLSGALPLIFSLFEIPRPEDPESIIDISLLKTKALDICERFNVPSTAVTDEYLDLFSRQAFAEFTPIAAVIGGAVAQDVIQFLSKKESPINNVLILDSIKSEMPIYLL